MIARPRLLRLLSLFATLSLPASLPAAKAVSDPAAFVPPRAPRTLVLPDKLAAFRAYVTTGEGARAFARIREDYERQFATFTVPPEPATYGDPSPSKRSSDLADL